MVNALLPCPLCGMKPEAVSRRETPPLDYLYRCPRCRLETRRHTTSLSAAATHWNDAVLDDRISLFCIHRFA